MKTIFSFLAIVLTITTSWCGTTIDSINHLESVLNKMSEGAYYLSGGEECYQYDPKTLSTQLFLSGETCHQIEIGDPEIINTIEDFEQFADDQFTLELAKGHKRELKCAEKFAQNVAKNKNDIVSSIADKMVKLRKAKQELTNSTEHLANNPYIAGKVCPLSLKDLMPSPHFPEGQDLYYNTCEKIIKHRIAYQTILSTIPLSDSSKDVKKLLEYYAGVPSGKEFNDLNMNLRKSIRDAYGAASNDFQGAQKDLSSLIKEGAKSFGRGDRRYLMSDPRMVTNIIEHSDTPNEMKGLACRMDARYGKGARQLDTLMAVGSLALGGGIGATVKAGSFAFGALRGISAARATGLISANTSRMLKLSSLGGALTADSIMGFSDVSSSCLKNVKSKKIVATENRRCVSTPKIEDAETENCYLMATLSVLGILGGYSGLKHLYNPPEGIPPVNTEGGINKTVEPLANSAPLQYSTSTVSPQRTEAQISFIQTPTKSTNVYTRKILGKNLEDNVLTESHTITYVRRGSPPTQGSILEILPEGDSPLNRFVRRMGSQTGGTKVYIVGDELLDNANGSYDLFHNRIFLSADSFKTSKKASDNTTLLHEFRHALKAQEIRSGKYNPYHGSMKSASEGQAMPNMSRSNPYQSFMSFDESQTFRDDSRRKLRNLLRIVNDSDKAEETQRMMDSIRNKTSIGTEISFALSKNLKKIDNTILNDSDITTFFWNPDQLRKRDTILAAIDTEHLEINFDMNELDQDFVSAWNSPSRTEEARNALVKALRKRINDLIGSAEEDRLQMTTVSLLTHFLRSGAKESNEFMINAFESALNAGKRYKVSESPFVVKAAKLEPGFDNKYYVDLFSLILSTGIRQVVKDSKGNKFITYRMSDDILADDDVNLTLILSENGEFLDLSTENL